MQGLSKVSFLIVNQSFENISWAEIKHLVFLSKFVLMCDSV